MSKANEDVKHNAFPGPRAIAARLKIVGRGNQPFRSRSHAGRKLAKALAGYKLERPVVSWRWRASVPDAAEVCAAFNAPLDLILVR